jgi:hypothetical protein
MPAPLLAPLLSVFGKQAGKKALFSGKSGKSGKSGMFGKSGKSGLSLDTFRTNVVKNAPSKSQTNWILIISIIAFVFSALVFLTYTLIEDFDGGMSRPRIAKSNNISKREKYLINKRTTEYIFGRNVPQHCQRGHCQVNSKVLLEGFNGVKAFSPDPFETIPSLKILRVPKETNYSAIKGRAHTKIDNKDNKKQLKYNLLF